MTGAKTVRRLRRYCCRKRRLSDVMLFRRGTRKCFRQGASNEGGGAEVPRLWMIFEVPLRQVHLLSKRHAVREARAPPLDAPVAGLGVVHGIGDACHVAPAHSALISKISRSALPLRTTTSLALAGPALSRTAARIRQVARVFIRPIYPPAHRGGQPPPCIPYRRGAGRAMAWFPLRCPHGSLCTRRGIVSDVS